MSRIQNLTALLGSPDTASTASGKPAKPYELRQGSQDAHILELLIQYGNTKSVAEYADMCDKRRGVGKLSPQSFRQRCQIVIDKVLSGALNFTDEQIDSILPSDYNEGGQKQGRRKGPPVDLSKLAEVMAARFAAK